MLPIASQKILKLVEMCKELSNFSQWVLGKRKHCNKKQGVPVEFLVLFVLSYLGRGWTIYNFQESVFINQEIICLFLLKFIEFRSTTLYDKYVVQPATTDNLNDCNHEFKLVYLLGCIGSTDGTHILIQRCIYLIWKLHLGYKLTRTVRTYNLTVNHCRRILSSTSGHHAMFTDKTLIRFDRFVNAVNNGCFDDEFEF